MYGLTGISKVADSTRRRGAPAATLVALALVVLLIALAGRAAALAEELRPDVTVRAANSTLTGAEYRAAYGYTTDESADVYITGWQVNGGSYGSNAPARALDGDFSTFWETNTPNSDDFANAFTLTFSSVATVDRVLYRVRTDGQAGRGYPLALTVYASADEEGETFERVGYAESALTRSAAGDFTVATFAGSADTRAVKAKAWDGTRERACSLSEDGKRLYVAVITLATDSGATMLPTDGNGMTLPELPAAEGKRALGWRAESGELLLPGDDAGGVSALFTAEYALEYTLIFGDRGSFTLIEGESVTAPSPSDPDFLGWAPEGSDESYDGTVVLTADLAALADDSRTIRFRELRAAPPSDDNATDPDDSGDPDALPLWPFMIGGALAVIVVGGAIIVILGLRKQRNDRR